MQTAAMALYEEEDYKTLEVNPWSTLSQSYDSVRRALERRRMNKNTGFSYSNKLINSVFFVFVFGFPVLL